MNVTHPFLLMLLLTLTLLSACKPELPAARKQPPAAVTIETLKPGPIDQILQLTGTVEAATVATLSSPAEGPVQLLSVREGDFVSQGQVLLVIGRDASAEASLSSAKEEVSRQQREYDRIQALVKDRALPGDQLDAARSALERARAQLAQAEQASRDFTVTAPWDGVVSRLHVADGRYLAPRTALVDLFDPSSLVLRFQVPEQHAFHVEQGNVLTATLDAFPGELLNLTVDRVWPELDRRLRTRTFEATLPLDSLQFAPGQFARVSVVIARLSNALTVPVEALLYSIEGEPEVMRVEDDLTASRIPVKTGFERGGRVVLLSGVAAGDRIVVTGMGLVQPGKPVSLVGKGKTQP